jgi:hypothetical protein
MLKTERKLSTVEECQEGLSRLAEEEAALPTLEAAREQGDYQQAADLAAEPTDLEGPRLKRIVNGRAATNMILWPALATELERQADKLEAGVAGQQKKEAQALSQLEK